jgi:cell division septation protein DedD
MNLQKHIRHLLFERNHVVVPGLGSFTAQYVSADIHPVRHTFVPPSKSITFQESTKSTDEILIRHVASQETLSRSQAERAIAEFVAEVRKELTEKGNYRFEDIGTITVAADGKWQFEGEKTINFLGASFGLPDLEFKPVERGNAARTIATDRAAVSDANFKSKEEPAKPVAVKREKEKRFSGNRLQAALIPVLLFLAIAFGYFGFLDKGNTALSSFNPFPLFIPGFFDKSKPVTQLRPPQPDTVAQATMPPENPKDAWGKKTTETPASQPLTPAKEEKKPEKEVIRKVKNVATVRYYVIIGGFGSEANAQKLVNQLVQQGHTDARVMPPGGNALFKVSISDYDNQQSAEVQANALQSEYKGAWVMKK